MDILKNKKKKIIFILFFIGILFFPLITQASIGAEIVSSIMGFFANLAQTLIGYLLMLMGFLADKMLDLNIKGINKDVEVIKYGWQISRDLANLGFVLAIIIIGFATIIQFKNYGVKKLLPKLIIAALLVNFSLALVTPILGFSNTLTKFFLGSRNDVSEAIAGAFNPQKLVMGGTGEEIPPLDSGETGMLGALLMGVINIIFVVIFTSLAALSMGALAIMLLIRYVVLIFLLILSPIIWLAWVIPELGSQFKAWWNSFLKWTFFAPIVSFFIYLSLTTAKNISANSTFSETYNAQISSDIAKVFNQGIQMIVICGLMLAGLYAADKMGIGTAKGAIGIANKSGNWMKGRTLSWAKRNAMRAGSTVGRQKVKDKDGNEMSRAEKARKYANSSTNLISRKIASWTASALTANEEMGTKGATKEYKERTKGLSTERKLAMLPGASKTLQMSLLEDLAKDGKINKLTAEKYLTDKWKNKFNSYGKSKSFGDIEKGFGMSLDMLKAKKEKGVDSDEFKKETKKFYDKLEKKDLDKTPIKEIFSGEGKLGFEKEELEKISQVIADSISIKNRGLVPKIYSKLNSKAKDNFKKIYEKSIKKLKESSDAKERKEGEQAEKAYNNTIANWEGGIGPYSPDEKEPDKDKKENNKDNKEEAKKNSERKKARHS